MTRPVLLHTHTSEPQQDTKRISVNVTHSYNINGIILSHTHVASQTFPICKSHTPLQHTSHTPHTQTLSHRLGTPHRITPQMPNNHINDFYTQLTLQHKGRNRVSPTTMLSLAIPEGHTGTESPHTHLLLVGRRVPPQCLSGGVSKESAVGVMLRPAPPRSAPPTKGGCL